MNVTLRKAHALSKALLEAAKKVPLNRTVTLSVYDDEDVEDRASTAGDALVDAVDRIQALTKAGFGIRDLVSAQNHKKNIDDLLTEKAQLETFERTLLKALGETSEDYDFSQATPLEIAGAKMQALRERNDNAERSYGLTEELKVRVVTDDIKADFASRLHQLRRRKAEIADKLLELNTKTTIQLPQATVTLLTDEKLI